MNLTLKILEAAAEISPRMLDLANVDDLSWILGIPAIADPVTGKYPEPLNEILDRNLSMSDAIADGGNVSVIEAEWNDLLSIQDGINSTSIADLSIHVNQAPTGVATAILVSGLENMAYNILASDLLQGFSDADGGTLSISGLNADNGVVTDNGDGTFTITPNANYVGPVEMTYTVDDGQGGSASASQLFVIAPTINETPTTSAVTLAAIAEDSGVRVITQAELLVSAGDVDGDTLTVNTLAIASGLGALVANLDGTWSYTPALNDASAVIFSYNVTDGVATVAGIATLDITPVNDAPTTSAVTLAAIAEDSGVRLITQAELLASAGDVDGDTLTVNTLAIASGLGALVDNLDGTWSYTPALNDASAVIFSYNVTDGIATVVGSATLDITPVNDAPTTSAVTLAAIAEDSGVRVITQAELLANAGDVDGDTLTVNTLAIASGLGALVANLDGTWSYTPALNDASVVIFSYNVTDGVATVAGSATLDITPTLPLIGTAGADILNGNAGNDLIFGLAGHDILNGYAGNDTLYGDAGNDTLNGGNDDDVLEGGAGKDTLNGELGVDTASYANSTKGVSVNLQANTASGGDAQGDHLYGIENLIGSDFNDTLVGNGGFKSHSGGRGDDDLRGLGGSDTLTSNLGADKFDFDAITDSGIGINADLILDFEHGGINYLSGGRDNDVLRGLGGSDTLNGGLGTDRFDFDAITDRGIGINADLILDFEHRGINYLSGGRGNDVLRGLGGSDTLNGGLGADRFDFDAITDSGLGVNADLILDFEQGKDLIDLSTIDTKTLTLKRIRHSVVRFLLAC